MQIDFKNLNGKVQRFAAGKDVSLLRKGVQLAVVAIVLSAGWQFYNFVEYIRLAGTGPVPGRPPVVEGFLPIAAIVASKVAIALGVIDTVHPAGLFIFIATLLTAWVFRRALCSWICPIGTLSEYLASMGRNLMGRNLNMPRWLEISLLSLKYLLFLFIFKLFFLMPSADAVSFMRTPYYAISDIKMLDMVLGLGPITLAVILVIVLISIYFKSFWCRYLCPYGAFLGILGLLSPVFLIKNPSTCVKCNKCTLACPNGVSVGARQNLVATTECIGCTMCIAACPNKDTLQFKLLGVLPIKPLAYSIGFLAVFFGIIMLAKAIGYWDTSLTLYEYRYFDQIMSGAFGPG